MQPEHVILVNEHDEPLGTMEKMEAHEKGVLHRAFSVFIFNKNNELMLQQRAWHKYHSPGLWTNTCCSHQRLGEDSVAAGRRRLREEMGFDVSLEFKVSFIYKAPFENGLTEHELDHVLVGSFEGKPQLNPREVASWKWMPMNDLINDIEEHPDKYTVWFKIIFDKYCKYLSL